MAETHENAEVKKSPKKLIIIIVVALLLIGGGVGGYFFYMKSTSAPEHAEEPTNKEHAEAEEHKKAEAEEVGEDGKPIPDVFYDLPSPLIVDFPSGSSAKVIKISLSIQVKGEANMAILKKNDPMLRNNMLMAISAIGADKIKTTEGKLELRAQLLAEVGKVLEKMSGKNTAKNVYFTDFVMQ